MNHHHPPPIQPVCERRGCDRLARWRLSTTRADNAIVVCESCRTILDAFFSVAWLQPRGADGYPYDLEWHRIGPTPLVGEYDIKRGRWVR